MNTLATLMFSPLPSEVDAVQQKSWVTYTPIRSSSAANAEDPTLTLKENRAVISGAGTTGLRTWEAALHLASYLCSDQIAATSYIEGKHVVELGAGTGFLSILCAKHLQAKYVTSTDGDEGVIDALKENLFYNDAETEVSTGVVRWGWALKDTLIDYETENHGTVDTVIGADVTYDKAVIPALVATIRNIFEKWPEANVLISATIRNEQTFAAFERACGKSAFQVQDVDFPLLPISEQTSLFHSADVPIRILKINAPKEIKDPFAV